MPSCWPTVTHHGPRLDASALIDYIRCRWITRRKQAIALAWRRRRRPMSPITRHTSVEGFLLDVRHAGPPDALRWYVRVPEESPDTSAAKSLRLRGLERGRWHAVEDVEVITEPEVAFGSGANAGLGILFPGDVIVTMSVDETPDGPVLRGFQFAGESSVVLPEQEDAS